MADKPQCKAIKAGGGRCSNRAQEGQDFCWSHSKETAEQRREYAAAGGRARSRRPPDELEKIKEQIKTVTGAVLRGQVDRGRGAIALQGFNTLLRAIETERKLDRLRELEEAVDELEARLAEVRRTQWVR
jgi:hypothetical protein